MNMRINAEVLNDINDMSDAEVRELLFHLRYREKAPDDSHKNYSERRLNETGEDAVARVSWSLTLLIQLVNQAAVCSDSITLNCYGLLALLESLEEILNSRFDKDDRAHLRGEKPEHGAATMEGAQ